MQSEHEEFIRQLKEIQDKLAYSPPTAEAPKPDRYKSAGSNVPYYREAYALEIKFILDEMKVGTPVLIKCQIAGLAIRSLEAKLYQARCYLCDKLDTPDGKYAKLCRATRLRKFQKSAKHPNITKF